MTLLISKTNYIMRCHWSLLIHCFFYGNSASFSWARQSFQISFDDNLLNTNGRTACTGLIFFLLVESTPKIIGFDVWTEHSFVFFLLTICCCICLVLALLTDTSFFLTGNTIYFFFVLEIILNTPGNIFVFSSIWYQYAHKNVIIPV